MPTSLAPSVRPRLGFHYFPDSLHYRQADLETWLPILQASGAAWLTLLAPLTHTIPENFITGLQGGGIEPLVHLPLNLKELPAVGDVQLLLACYARWGVRYVALFDRPNLRAQWAATVWARQNLVERFLDVYLPLAEAICHLGMIPIFPPLEPGGDYWDTSFLRAALQGLRRRAHPELVERLALGAYAWSGNKPLTWGAGGPERWPGAQPYRSTSDDQDQRGLCIFDWYQAIGQAELHRPVDLLLLRMGVHPIPPPTPPLPHPPAAGQDRPSLPPEVLAGCLWLLATSPGNIYASQAWFQPDGSPTPAQKIPSHLAQILHLSPQNGGTG